MLGRIRGAAWPKLRASYCRLKCQRCRNNRKHWAAGLRGVLAKNTDEFCKHTTLHGLKYVGSKQLYPIERCFFGVSIVVVLLLSGIFILKLYSKWANTPVIVGINPVSTPITNEPFPAVTICNLNQALKSKAQNLMNKTKEYATLQLLCKRQVDRHVAASMSDWSNLEQFIERVSQPCNRMVVACRFGGRDCNCNETFYPIVTDEGLCCVFNMLHPSLMFVSHVPHSLQDIPEGPHKAINWYAEQGYPSNLPPRYYPRATPAIGESMGLSVILDVEYDEYYCSSSSSVGFKVSLHSPNEAPNVRETGVLIEPGRESKVRIRPEKIETVMSLRSMPQQYRQCLFHDEGKLRYFNHYTQRNCESECVAAALLKHCNCIGYYMPRFDQNASICSITQTSCVEMVRLRTDPTITSCLEACLPSCFDLNFSADVFATHLDHEGFKIANNRLERYSHQYVRKNIAIVNMYFKEYSFRSHIKTEFIGLADFLSSVGGLMGLFLGFSFISIAELLYFGILRPLRAFCQHHRAVEELPHRRNLQLNHKQLPEKRRNIRKQQSWSRIYQITPPLEGFKKPENDIENNAVVQTISGTIQPYSNAHTRLIFKPLENVWQE